MSLFFEKVIMKLLWSSQQLCLCTLKNIYWSFDKKKIVIHMVLFDKAKFVILDEFIFVIA